MIKLGRAIYMDENNRLFSRRSKNRTFLGWSHTNGDIEEGAKLLLERFKDPDDIHNYDKGSDICFPLKNKENKNE